MTSSYRVAFLSLGVELLVTTDTQKVFLLIQCMCVCFFSSLVHFPGYFVARGKRIYIF